MDTDVDMNMNVDAAVSYLPKEPLDEILVRAGMVTAEQMQDIWQIVHRDSKTVEQVLIEKKLLTPRDLATALSIQLRVPLIDLRRHKIRPEALKLVPEHLARKYNALPLDIIGEALTVVMEDTRDVRAIDDIAAVSKMRIEPMMGLADDIRRAIDHNYSVRGSIGDEIIVTVEEEEESEEIISEDMAAQAPALRNLNSLIQQAERSRASDIHIEPQEDKLQIRFRIDGELQDVMSLPLSMHAALISRIKIVSGMNIAERRRPQDGRFSARVDDKDIDIRVACGNTVHGEMAVLRLLSKSASLLELQGLGFIAITMERYNQLLNLPFGMILFGGPTGSGKTTTLYASINQLNRMKSNIMTIEDPVEYHFEGINQFQVNPKAGVTFADGLRSFMRLDPDVILVGEIRDSETAKIATQAALTGHLVFSSIHANDAVGVLFRLLDLDVEKFVLCSALVGTLAQRIVRRICPHCRVPYEPTAEEVALYEKEIGRLPDKLYKGAGCNLCVDTGYLGRVALFELLVITESIKKLLLEGAAADEIREQAIKERMVPLMLDGMIKVRKGITTISEVLRHVYTTKLW